MLRIAPATAAGADAGPGSTCGVALCSCQNSPSKSNGSGRHARRISSIPLLHPPEALLVGHLQVIELDRRVAGADADDQPAIADDVQRGEFLGQHHRVVEGGHDDRRSEPDLGAGLGGQALFDTYKAMIDELAFGDPLRSAPGNLLLRRPGQAGLRHGRPHHPAGLAVPDVRPDRSGRGRGQG